MNQYPALFSPFTAGELQSKNRIWMAPLTRCRAEPTTLAPTALSATYYAQRASAGVIVSEAVEVCPEGKGYVGAPGIYSAAQAEGWKLVADAVHAQGGAIVAQLWHVGAVSHPALQPNGQAPVSSSAYTAVGTTATPEGKRDRVPARALTRDEIPALIETYRHAAQVAKRAGLDGVEIHSANGYLLEQFIRDAINHRDDDYGGSIQNRIRLTLEVVDAAISVYGKGRVGIRLSPVTDSNGAPQDRNPTATYHALIDALDARGIAYIHFIEGDTGRSRDTRGFDFASARKRFRGAAIGNNQYTAEMADAAVRSGLYDAIAFGRPFIANPDLPHRLQINAPLNQMNVATLYAHGAEGYTDYPPLKEGM